LVADYLPGDAATARASLVICNGGSLTTQQALAAGKPVLGIASNMDQHLNMGALCRAGAGELLRAGTVTAGQIGTRVMRMLDCAAHRDAAAELGRTLGKYPAPVRFQALVHRALAGCADGAAGGDHRSPPADNLLSMSCSARLPP
jgi:UDP:flavonoid glycosyltransferase YjiC (YdhE family)